MASRLVSQSLGSPLAPLTFIPGLLLVGAVSVAALAVASVEERIFGHPIVEALVVAILLGMILRTAWTPPPRVDPGVRFAAKQMLEVAVFLLGISVNLPLLVRAGAPLAMGIVLLVVLGLASSFAIGRALGLPTPLAVLIACGNSICGNSAIAAVAPVIDAKQEHVASSIAFTAILGVVVVVGLPLLMHPLGLNDYQYGVLAGLTVYAVPQVLAAAFPVSVLAGQVGTLVKLVRVLMLGPVVIFFAIRHRHAQPRGGEKRPSMHIGRLVPWFIVGFLLLAALRSSGIVPDAWVDPTRTLSVWLTIAAMAALGLGVDLKAIAKVGRPVVTTVTASLFVLLALAIALIRTLRIG